MTVTWQITLSNSKLHSTDAPSLTDLTCRRNQDGLVRYMDKVVANVADKANMRMFALLGGCEPKNGGDILTLQ